MARSQYRIALYDEEGRVIEGVQYMHVSEDTPTPGQQINVPHGTWFVHQIVATGSGEPSSRLFGSDPYGGTLICHPHAPVSQ
jgi:hypothetical protein